jgi:rare lipoprotein A
LILAAVALSAFAANVSDAKTPGKTYCFYKKCHRVKSLSETRELVGQDITIAASHYNDCRFDRYNPCGLTSSGEKFHPDRADNAASPIYPDGTILLVWHKSTRDAAVIRINNAGPYWGNRKLDVSIATAEQLGFRGRGVTTLETRVIKAPDEQEAQYSRNRRYHPVPGYIGKHESIEAAERAAVAAMAVSAIAASTLAPPSGAVAMSGQAETKDETRERIKKAQDAERLRAASRRIEQLEPRTLSSARVPARTVTDAWTGPAPAEQVTLAEEVQEASLETGNGLQLASSVVKASFTVPAPRLVRPAQRARNRQIETHTLPNVTPDIEIPTKEVETGWSWTALLFDLLGLGAKSSG